jgi:integrase
VPDKVELTQEIVRDFDRRPAKGGRLYLLDATERGLQLAVTQTGIKSFFWRGTFDGKDQRVPLGRFPETSVGEARRRCVLVRAAVEQGRDPRAALSVSRRRRGAITLADFLEIYLERMPPERDAETVRRMFEYYAADLASRPMQSVSSNQLRKWHKKIGERSGEPAANKAAGILCAMFNKAMAWDDPAGGKYANSNPASAAAVPRFPEEPRDRFMSLAELATFRAVMEETESRDARDFFRIALFTGQRKRSVMEMAFSELDLNRGTWTIPKLPGRKLKRPHVLPLAARAVDLLEFRRRLVRGPWVFPGRRRNGKPIGNVYFWWEELCEKAGFEDLRIHDLRRTLASYMAMTGASYQVIAQLLAHKMPGPTAIYARLDVEPVRDAIETAIEGMGFATSRK